MSLTRPDLLVLSVSLDSKSRKTISTLARVLGIAQSVRIERKVVLAVRELSTDAVKYLQDYVPRKTGELAGSFRVDEASITPFKPSAEIYVNGDEHTSSRPMRDGSKPTNSWLAEHLNKHDFRSRGALKTTTTKNWIESARDDFDALLDEF